MSPGTHFRWLVRTYKKHSLISLSLSAPFCCSEASGKQPGFPQQTHHGNVLAIHSRSTGCFINQYDLLQEHSSPCLCLHRVSAAACMAHWVMWTFSTHRVRAICASYPGVLQWVKKMRFCGLNAGFNKAKFCTSHCTELSGMTVKCGVAPWWTVKISPRKLQEIGARPKKFNKRQQTPWEFDFGMF